ncbi:signal transduction protein [Arsukibacterium sp. MJ3]|uniref:HDOD domain-containing protein n=1 Tax=Arsukibacterium sp. MJ3 TaxID=1632859 RepID=UPI000627349D|nr:HDOD domain-containing protein [Arsukibacterium sp. MJ3]KKO49624.1 signal transduction protein [Arsukibacterium sp. MJ3]
MTTALDMTLIERALTGFTIPPRPEILQHIQQQLAINEPSISRIAALINLDVGIAGFTLKVVNSAFFGLSQKITSIEHACKYLGLNRVLALVRSVVLRFTLAEGRQDAFSQRLWSSALHTATIAMALAKQFNLNQSAQDDCYSLGLFHNAGIALITAQAPQYAALMQSGLQAGVSYSEIEEQHFQTCHEVLGYLIAQSWGLTTELCNVIAYHHSPALILQSANDYEQQLFALLKLAEFFSGESRVLYGINVDPEWQSFSGAILDVLELESLSLPDFAELLHQQDILTVYSLK